MTEYEEQQTKKTNRFLTLRKDKAFALAESLNKTEVTNRMWYVGIRVYNRIVIDLDSHDEANLYKIKWFYSRMFQSEFITSITSHGYHLVTKERYTKDESQFLRCKLLIPGLPEHRLYEYLNACDTFFQQQKEERRGKEYTLTELQTHAKDMRQIITEAGLNHSVGNIDVLHALIGIQRGYYVIRVSKKSNMEKVIS
jgi:hypothetical protein